MTANTPLAIKLRGHIQQSGPISIADYMHACLLDPIHGFYPTRDPMGSNGDFTSAPEISSLFSDCLGLWVIRNWHDMGRPSPFNLIELGPGIGTMMADIIKIIATQPACHKALRVHLVEASAALQSMQGRKLERCGAPVMWADQLDDIDMSIPSLILGNEFLDCLPVRQFIYSGSKLPKWQERFVGLDENDNEGDLIFKDVDLNFEDWPSLSGVTAARPGDIVEVRPAISPLVKHLSERFNASSGRALFIDYGPIETEIADTLSALQQQTHIGLLDEPGRSDMTAQVDFGDLIRTAKHKGLTISGPVSQREFLSRLGIESRAISLLRNDSGARPHILGELYRLLDTDEMGTRFKAVCLSADNLPDPVGFS